MISMFRDVGIFHEKFNLPTANPGPKYRRPQILNDDEFHYRLNFLKEELQEFVTAHAQDDLEGCADALADLVWVALGTAHYMGIPFDAIWAEVNRANLEKRPWQEGDPVKPRAKHLTSMALEIAKPVGWKAPELNRIIAKALPDIRGCPLCDPDPRDNSHFCEFHKDAS